jgi:predicted TPR repeat methyltransferase
MPALSRTPGEAQSLAIRSQVAMFADAHVAHIMPPTPSAALGLTREGLALFAVGDFSKAEQAFRAVVEVAPDQALAWNNLALVLVALDEPQEAASALRRSLALDGSQLTAWISLANVLAALGLTAEAEQACDAALALDGTSPEAWQIRAFLHAQAEDFQGAAEAFSRAIEIAGESPALYLNLGAALLKCGRFDAAAIALGRALDLDPASAAAQEFKRICDLAVAAIAGDLAAAVAACAADPDRMLKTAVLLLTGADEREAAGRLATAWTTISPDNVEAAHLRDAALAREVDRQPAALVAQHFDGIADDFDDRLVRRLGYQGPEGLAALIGAEIAPAGALDILDLGCGSGLCGPMLRPFARRLAGIDLSARMLVQARRLGLYDSLEVADLLGALGDGEARWDLLIAADTFPYLGDLEAVFAGAVRSLRDSGWFAFTTETADGDSYVLQANGRFAQGPGYIARMAAGRFAIAGHATAPIRREAGRSVIGEFFLLRRTAEA